MEPPIHAAYSSCLCALSHLGREKGLERLSQSDLLVDLPFREHDLPAQFQVRLILDRAECRQIGMPGKELDRELRVYDEIQLQLAGTNHGSPA